MAAQDDQAEQAAFYQQYQADKAQKAQQEQATKQPPSFLDQFAVPLNKVSTTLIDTAVHAADMWGRSQQDLGAGELTAAANTVDAVHSFGRGVVKNFTGAFSGDNAAEQAISNDSAAGADRMRSLQQPPSSPIWDHARQSILDFRDAVAVKDPTLADSLTQSVAQLAIPFTGYSRALAGLHGIANTVAAGALTDMTALQPHDMRMADLVSQARQTEGKLGQVLRQVAPDGSALNAYLEFLTDRSGSEAENRWKNVLDGLTTNMIVTPFLHTVGATLKYGAAGTAYLAQNGVRNTLSDLAAPMKSPAELQQGKIVFHGTAANFDEFSDNAIGTGEGNQTFGYGHYFAENPATAGTYKQMAVSRNGLTGAVISDAQKAVKAAGGRAEAYSLLSQNMVNEKDPALRMRMQQTMAMIKSGNYDRGEGKLLHVEIPDEHIDNMMHWDQPVTEQPSVQRIFESLKPTVVPEGNGYRLMLNGKPARLFADGQAAREVAQELSMTGQEGINGGVAYDRLTGALGSQKAASEFLSRRGIPGIKYLDQGSRANGEGTRNLVVFNPKHAKIVKKE